MGRPTVRGSQGRLKKTHDWQRTTNARNRHQGKVELALRHPQGRGIMVQCPCCGMLHMTGDGHVC
jgi:hypothetical protein